MIWPPPGEPSAGEEFSVRSEDNDRRHRAQGALSGSRRVRDRLAVDDRLEGKIRQLVVEQETAGSNLRAEGASIDIVMETTSPESSTTARWLVPCSHLPRHRRVIGNLAFLHQRRSRGGDAHGMHRIDQTASAASR